MRRHAFISEIGLSFESLTLGVDFVFLAALLVSLLQLLP